MPGGSVKRYRKGEERTREILAATIDLIYEEGISAVSHRAVAKRAKVADSAPSYFFPSIDDLIVEAFRSIMEAMIDDLEALRIRIEEEDMDRETAVDEYLKLTVEAAPKNDKVQFEAYLFATRRPALRPEVDAAIAATQRQESTLVTASRRKDLAWAAPILTAYADGVGLHRIASPPDGIGVPALKDGLLALMESLPGRDPAEAEAIAPSHDQKSEKSRWQSRESEPSIEIDESLLKAGPPLSGPGARGPVPVRGLPAVAPCNRSSPNGRTVRGPSRRSARGCRAGQTGSGGRSRRRCRWWRRSARPPRSGRR